MSRKRQRPPSEPTMSIGTGNRLLGVLLDQQFDLREQAIREAFLPANVIKKKARKARLDEMLKDLSKLRQQVFATVENALEIGEAEIELILNLVGDIFNLSMEQYHWDFMLEKVLALILGVETEIGMKKGCIMKVVNDSGSEGKILHLAAESGFSSEHISLCTTIMPDQCLCGKFMNREDDIWFVPNIDHDHDIEPEGMQPHGHLFIKIRNENGEVSEIVNLYIQTGQTLDKRMQAFALAISTGVSSLRYAYNLKQRLLETANYDPTTRLLNGRYFDIHLEGLIKHREVSDPSIAVGIIDIKGVGEINEKDGKQKGNEVLQVISQKLSYSLGKHGVTMARLEGTSFAFSSRTEEGGLPILMNIIEECFSSHLDLAFSCGFCFYPSDGESVLANAKKTCKDAANVGERFRFFNKETDIRIKEEQALEKDLREAIESEDGKGLMLYYQPKVNKGKITSFEALIRWNRNGEVLAPWKFLSIAEKNGLLVPLGKWVMRRACEQAKQWQLAYSDVAVAINVDPQQLTSDDFLAEVGNQLKVSQIPPHLIELEIVESSGLSEKSGNIQRLLQELLDFGIRIAIDDFGTQNSTPERLRDLFKNLTIGGRYPAEQLIAKIDQTFVRNADFENGGNDQPFFEALVVLLRTMVGKVVVEGVEDEATLKAVIKSAGVDEIQGYHYSRPVPFDEAMKLLEEYNGRSSICLKKVG